jgi:hypothetical protein
VKPEPAIRPAGADTNPLDAVLSRLADQATSGAVRAWARSLIEGGESARDAGGEEVKRSARRRDGAKGAVISAPP